MQFPVCPVHTPNTTGACSCRNPKCGSPGKHPRTRNGFKDATTEESAIDRWWKRWPGANLGIRTGDGLVVVDIDGPEGERQVADLDLPYTVEASTGRGRHLYYAGVARSKTNLLPKVDLRGEGGFVVAPPSLHASGNRYEWVNSPGDTDLAPLPEWISECVRKPVKNLGTGARHRGPIARRPFRQGERNNELFRFACLLGSMGAHQREVSAALKVRNRDCCKPALAAAEVELIAQSAAARPGIYLSDQELLDQGIKPHTLPVYLALRARANHQGVCIAGYDALAEDSGAGLVRLKTVAIRELERLGLVHVERPKKLKKGTVWLANEYTLLDPENKPVSAPAEDTNQGE